MKNPRILELLAQGISLQQVLTIVGCSVQYLKDLIEDVEFKAELQAKTEEYYKEADEEVIIGNKYLSLEHKILKQIESQLGNADMRDSIRALEVVSARQEKSRNRIAGIQEGGKSRGNVNIVNISIPMHAIPEYVLNSNKEVISVGNLGMAPMQGNAVKELFQKMTEGRVIQNNGVKEHIEGEYDVTSL